MSATTSSPAVRTRFHSDAYQFLYAALRFTQRKLERGGDPEVDESESHVSGGELVEGIRDFAAQQFGLLTPLVFDHWGIHSTLDFGRMVFELVEAGEMRKTPSDQLEDFLDVYDFEDVFDRDYQFNTAIAFSH